MEGVGEEKNIPPHTQRHIHTPQRNTICFSKTIQISRKIRVQFSFAKHGPMQWVERRMLVRQLMDSGVSEWLLGQRKSTLGTESQSWVHEDPKWAYCPFPFSPLKSSAQIWFNRSHLMVHAFPLSQFVALLCKAKKGLYSGCIWLTCYLAHWWLCQILT